MKTNCFDREFNPAVLVGVHYNADEKRYYIVEDRLLYHSENFLRFSYAKAYEQGIMNYPCDYKRMESAVNNAKRYCDVHFAYKFVGFVPDYLIHGYDGTLEDAGKAFPVGHRRFRGENYTLKVCEARLLNDSAPDTIVTCLTPKNAFGYEDTLMLTEKGDLLQLYRNDVPAWIQRKLRPNMEFIKRTGCFYG